jgi:hypothetical protein
MQTTLAADVHLAEGLFLHMEETVNKTKSRIHLAGTRRPTISKTERQYLNQGKFEQDRVHRGDAYSYVNCAILTPQKQEKNNN